MCRFKLIGFPLGHSMSPFIHKQLAKFSGIDLSYALEEVPNGQLKQYIPSLNKLNGYNITIPYKEAIMPFLDEIDAQAKQIGAVNTVHIQNSKSTGYNTDGMGFLSALNSADVSLKGKVLICGNGGAARVMAFMAVKAQCDVSIAVRHEVSTSPANQIKIDMQNIFPEAKVQVIHYDDITSSFDLLCNATPAGMFPNVNAMPVSTKQLSHCAQVFDSIYNPKNTLLIKEAKKLGIKTCSGMAMLVHQAAYAHKIWFNTSFSPTFLMHTIEETQQEMERLFG